MHKPLNKIPMDDYCNYSISKSDMLYYLEECLDFDEELDITEQCAIIVESYFYHMADVTEKEYGMDWLVEVMFACLFCIKHNAMYPELINRMKEFIIDIDTGDYDYLFNEEDIDEFKADYNFIKDHINGLDKK